MLSTHQPGAPLRPASSSMTAGRFGSRCASIADALSVPPWRHVTPDSVPRAASTPRRAPMPPCGPARRRLRVGEPTNTPRRFALRCHGRTCPRPPPAAAPAPRPPQAPPPGPAPPPSKQRNRPATCPRPQQTRPPWPGTPGAAAGGAAVSGGCTTRWPLRAGRVAPGSRAAQGLATAARGQHCRIPQGPGSPGRASATT